MFENQNSIIITRVANGWIVILPKNNTNTFENAIAAGLKIAKGIHDDPLLNVNPESDNNDSETLINCNMNEFIFKSFDEVISFLKFKIA